jgi:tripeptidyl-peptidase-1
MRWRFQLPPGLGYLPTYLPTMFNNHLLVLMAFALVGLATPFDKRWVDMREKHSWVNIPRGWELHTPAPANHTLDMHIWMKQAGLDNLLSDLLQVSDPTHRRPVAFLRTHSTTF